MANVNVRIDPKLKKQAEDVFASLGISVSSAINIFYHQVVRTRGIPFELKADIPNETTVAAIEEAEEMAKHPKKSKSFSSVEDIMEDLMKWFT